MKWGVLIGVVALTLACAVNAGAADVDRLPGESDVAFAERVLRVSDAADPHVLAADWNGVPTLFVDYETSEAAPQRPLVALQRQADGGYRAFLCAFIRGAPGLRLVLRNPSFSATPRMNNLHSFDT